MSRSGSGFRLRSEIKGEVGEEVEEWLVDEKVSASNFLFSEEAFLGQLFEILRGGGAGDAEFAFDKFGFGIGMAEEIVEQFLAIDAGEFFANFAVIALHEIT